MTDILKVSAAAVAAAICCTVLRKQTPEVALVLAITAGGLLLWMTSSTLSSLVSFLKSLGETSGLSVAVMGPVLKVTGISIVTHTAGQFCRDANENGIASFLELAGTVVALVVTIPLAKAVLATVSGLL